jgi:hypothetical protein
MYELINRHFDKLLETVGQADIEPYVWMIRELPNRDVTRDEEFQKKYCSYWALNGAHLGQSFRTEYFRLLEREKCSPGSAEVERVTRKLFETPVNSKGKKALEFAFASKLVHMVNTGLPVYDRMVETFYFLPRSFAGKPEKKLQNLLASYQFLVKEYDRILRERILADALEAFRRRFCLPPLYSDHKIIDTLIWKFVPYLESGALRDGSVVYC